MQRRDFARTLLLGAGVACTSGTPFSRSAIAATADRSLHAQLAREQFSSGLRQWVPIERCRTVACAFTAKLRVDIETIDFGSAGEPLVVDAMFETHAGLKPFRIASFQPGSLSPLSKPFSFEITHASLAGFRGELGTRSKGSVRIAGVATSTSAHPTLSPGRYVLSLAGRTTDRARTASLPVAKLIFSVIDPMVG
jgi:hypothetical protein